MSFELNTTANISPFNTTALDGIQILDLPTSGTWTALQYNNTTWYVQYYQPLATYPVGMRDLLNYVAVNTVLVSVVIVLLGVIVSLLIWFFFRRMYGGSDY